MCGIVGYVGKNPMDTDTLISLAYKNIHRGDDGVGIITKNEGDKSFKVRKLTYSLNELLDRKLEDDNVKILKQVGFIEQLVKDEEKYNERQEKFKLTIDKIGEETHNVTFIHHRKATVGDKTTKNIHPVKIGKSYFIHNGTIDGIDTLKRYLEVYHEFEFKSETDSEVISSVFTTLYDKHKGDNKKVYEDFSNMFPEFGVLIQFYEGGFRIIKDEARPLWMYRLEEGGLIIISEPVYNIENFKKLLLISNGIYDSKDLKFTGYDYTEDVIDYMKVWKKAIKLDKIDNYKCDVCGTSKSCVRLGSQNGILSFFDKSFHDRCFECGVTKRKRESKGCVTYYGQYASNRKCGW